ncbi:hypothetical protein HanRHA438_Chr10g0458751 [Helianthus annuus]|nr:hypothetical protein HanRHA438_Chr10g0458751 [Helianthus annuus]
MVAGGEGAVAVVQPVLLHGMHHIWVPDGSIHSLTSHFPVRSSLWICVEDLMLVEDLL